jgi:hypothetical protein
MNVNNYPTFSEYGIRDKQAVMCTLMLRQQLGDTVNIITDLAVDNHIHLLDRHPYTGTCVRLVMC